MPSDEKWVSIPTAAATIDPYDVAKLVAELTCSLFAGKLETLIQLENITKVAADYHIRTGLPIRSVNLTSAIPTLVRLAKNPNPGIRLNSVLILARVVLISHQDPEFGSLNRGYKAELALSEAMSDADPSVRAAADNQLAMLLGNNCHPHGAIILGRSLLKNEKWQHHLDLAVTKCNVPPAAILMIVVSHLEEEGKVQLIDVTIAKRFFEITRYLTKIVAADSFATVRSDILSSLNRFGAAICQKLSPATPVTGWARPSRAIQPARSPSYAVQR